MQNSNSLDEKLSTYNNEQNGNPYCIKQLENQSLNEEPKIKN